MARIPRLRVSSAVKRAVWGGAIGLGVALLLLLLRSTELFETLELQLVDMRTRHHASRRIPDRRIVIAQIEETDVAEIQRQLAVPWPWPLEFNAHMIAVISEAGGTAVMVDILHLDRGAGPDDAADPEALSPAARQQRELEAEEAMTYADALEDFGKAAVAFELSNDPQYETPRRASAARSRLGAPKTEPPAVAIRRSGAQLPVRLVTKGAALLGFSNAVPDIDGVIRRAPVLGKWGEHTVLSLPLATARLAVGDKGLPGQALMEDGSFLVNHQEADFRGGYARVAPLQVLSWAMERGREGVLPAAAREALQGKIVVLGVNVAGIKDVVASPFGGTMDGPVFQATVLDNLLHGDGRVRAGSTTNLVVLLAFALLAGVLGALARGRFVPHLVPVGLAVACCFFAFQLFGGGTSIDLFTPLLALVLTWGGTTALRALTVGKRNRWLKGTFGRYMAPSIIEALKQDPALLELGGREREISVLFSDVAGFTSMSAALEAKDVVELLNRYLTHHCAAVLEEGGVVDKFEGDAVMAFWGDPVPQDDHAVRACRAALRVQADLPRLEPTLARFGVDHFAVRIGINTGTAVVGNMGSDQRFDYTCMGDTVNLASRLEGAGKAFETSILVGEATAAAVQDEILCKGLGQAVVVGRSEPVGVFEVLADRADASDKLHAHVQSFERSLDAARAGRLEEAREALAEAERLKPGDGPSRWFRGVLDGLDGAWDGVTVLSAK